MRARVPLGFHLCTALYKLLQHPGRPGATRARLGLADLHQIDPRVAATCGQIAAAPDVEGEAGGGGGWGLGAGSIIPV